MISVAKGVSGDLFPSRVDDALIMRNFCLFSPIKTRGCILRHMVPSRALASLGITLSAMFAFSQQPQGTTVQSSMALANLDQAIEQSHLALNAILKGDPKLYEELFAQKEDITLGNPFGPFARGRSGVVKTLEGAAAKYRDGTATVDLVAKYADDKMACIVEVENDRAKVGGSETLTEFHVRVTSLYELINGKWQLVHRHADPITTPRPAESDLQK